MSPKSKSEQQLDKLQRAERLQEAIATLEERIRQLKQEGELAPDGCYVARYQARGQRKAYWYYKLQASTPIFPTASSPGKSSRYKHLGAAGSAAHVDAVIQVVRRVQVDELQKAIDSLKESWLDLYSDEEEKTPKSNR
ncbi:MAG: hypothetical protein QNJ65_21975 [Xenococcaceae cyanobacterium MO_234.B1]|nr:hypothetical protein [Xenococcaceae cyanobacterium MO_234.B1]